jgi:hypothetical protein
MAETETKGPYVLAFRVTGSQLESLDAAINAQEIKPSRAQAGYHYFCKGLGVAETVAEVAPVKRASKTNNKNKP